MLPDKKIRKDEFERLSTEYINLVKDSEAATYKEGEEQVWENIGRLVQQHKYRRIRKILVYSLSTAASVLILLGGTYLFSTHQKRNSPATFKDVVWWQPIEEETSDKILLLTSANETLFIEDDAELKYDKDGNIQVNSTSLYHAKTDHKAMNQLIVPKGKRMNLCLSDGTKMVINSKTRVAFPTVFDEKKRSIFVDGEMYLDVKKDDKCPFYVEMNHLTVHVCGTSFNVHSYSGENESTVVLVSGKVEVTTGNEEVITLSPNEMFRLKGKSMEKKAVDVSEYICWTQNIMMFNQEPLDKALLRLSTHYEQQIVLEDSLGNIPLNGKIDLKNSFNEVLGIIEATAPVTFTSRGEHIYVNKKTRE